MWSIAVKLDMEFRLLMCTFIHLALDFSIYSPVSSRSGNSTAASAICWYMFPSGALILNEVIAIYRIFRNLIPQNICKGTQNGSHFAL